MKLLCQKLLGDARLYELLGRIDADLARAVREAGCSECGGRLDRARYPRKPRGALVALGGEYETRESFCCAVEGCRKRHTPPSVRYLGRKVYLGAVVVLASAMQHGPTRARVARLRELLGVSLRTLARWREWWRTAFAQSAFWRGARGLLVPAVDERSLPLSLLERFGSDEQGRLVALLRWLGPLTVPVENVAAI